MIRPTGTLWSTMEQPLASCYSWHPLYGVLHKRRLQNTNPTTPWAKPLVDIRSGPAGHPIASNQDSHISSNLTSGISIRILSCPQPHLADGIAVPSGMAALAMTTILPAATHMFVCKSHKGGRQQAAAAPAVPFSKLKAERDEVHPALRSWHNSQLHKCQMCGYAAEAA